MGRLSRLSYLKPHLWFYFGLIVGGAVSLVIYILVFAAFLSGVLQALVAIGTLAVATVTGYITIRDRREALAREMADRIYVPMRKQAVTWQDPEPSGVVPSWDKIQQELPYLISRVDPTLRKVFDKAEELLRQMGILLTPIDEAITAIIERFAQEGDYGKGAAPTPRIRIMKGFSKVGDFDVKLLVIRFLKTGETLNHFVDAQIARNRPDLTGCYVEFYAPPEVQPERNLGVDKTESANRLFGHIIDALGANPSADLLRSDYKELKDLATKAIEKIDKELRSPVASIISSLSL